MSEYIEPTQDSFDSTEQVVLDVVTSASPSAITKVGSVVRELVIRPIAYALTWALDNLENERTKSSVAYLKTSQATENDLADAVASNYFITRKQGTQAKGVVTLTLTSPVLRLPSGSQFTVGDVEIQTQYSYFITNAPPATYDDTIHYLTAIAYGNQYIVNVPVVAVDAGQLEIAAGTDITMNFVCSLVTACELTSSITGGSDTETDAEMMQRAEAATATAGIGTYYGLLKKMKNAPINVSSISVVAGEDDALYRARYNSLNINPGGFIDCFVKTQNQASTKAVTVTFTKTGTTYSGSIAAGVADGLFRVLSVLVDGANIAEFNVEYGSADATMDALGARLSCKQTVTISFTTTQFSADTLTGTCSVDYMPGLTELQEYTELPTSKFIGQDVLCKAAVPITVSLSCAVSCTETASDADLDTLKQVIVDYINAIPTGTRYLNFSDIQKACRTYNSSIALRLPCVMSCGVILTDGGSDTLYSNTGILDIGNITNTGYWDHKMCFFSTCLANIRIEQV